MAASVVGDVGLDTGFEQEVHGRLSSMKKLKAHAGVDEGSVVRGLGRLNSHYDRAVPGGEQGEGRRLLWQ